MACGIGTQKALAQYNENVEGAKIHIGIGINMGEPIRDADDYFGGSVNLAARICAVAEWAPYTWMSTPAQRYPDKRIFDLHGRGGPLPAARAYEDFIGASHKRVCG